ncbi:MAG: 1,4-alpha-glucan branching protein GlgB [SAR202 cluster bacterium]|nr:1,4-alpha-glucan branching protein GlgB [SAR202 cluster bacterium]
MTDHLASNGDQHGADPSGSAESSIQRGSPIFTADDLQRFKAGTDACLHRRLGAHLAKAGEAEATRFAVWAPNAAQVGAIGDFNGWDGGAHPLRLNSESGVWEGLVPGVGAGSKYKFRITAQNTGRQSDKADPFGFYHETSPNTASIVWDLAYEWEDGEWMREREKGLTLDGPLSIYEVHLGSWMRASEKADQFLTYRELAPKLAEYVEEMGFTHVEFLPIMEHPFYGSWGYQATGNFAPTSRYGTPQDFMFLLNHMHQRGIGVILDWAPFHFPDDEHGLARFDGTHLFEHPDLKRGFYPEWNTIVFNFDCPEVRSFLLSCAMFWLEEYHADGLRLDAVASMMYFDYLRKQGEWLPNEFGGRENLNAIGFLKDLNGLVHKSFPGAVIIAEDSTDTKNVSLPVDQGGLGFDMKWDLGWTHDLYDYMVTKPDERPGQHRKLTFRASYAFEQNFLIPLSHDEVKPGMGSLYGKLPGDDWEKRAGVRLLIGSMYVQPGKKLLFMGGEFGQSGEWQHDESLDWSLLNEPGHLGIQQFVKDLNRLHNSNPAFHQLDFEPAGFEWIHSDDAEKSVVTFLRQGRDSTDTALVICNFSPMTHHNYRTGVPGAGQWRELLNSDASDYGGSGLGNLGGVDAEPVPCHGRQHSVTLTLPPLSILIFDQPGDRD